MPANWVVVAHFYDIESGRKDLEQRGRGSEHEKFAIPIPRDGGIQDLLEAAARPDRQFAAVICESIERVARRTYFGTKIEYELERCGVALCAADEPMGPAPGHRRSTSTLTRRVKQAVAEWYVLQLLELSWGGTVEHTHQGWNIGKPPYGYIAEKVPHPVPAKRAEGRTKHRLIPHPEQAPVVARVFELRVTLQLGYRAIADELNRDLTLNPPPEPTRAAKRVGRWTGSAVREILVNPKYTGYMVYNRRATKQRGGRNNPPTEWIWSSQPVHHALVSLEQFEAVGALVCANNPRAAAGQTAKPDTAQYLLRSFLWCELCGRRMWGKANPSGRVYYVCAKDRRQHTDQPWFTLHPAAVRVCASAIEPAVHGFLARHLPLGELPTGRAMEPGQPPLADSGAVGGQADQLALIRGRQARLVEELEALDEHGLDDAGRTMLRTDILARYAHLGLLVTAHTAPAPASTTAAAAGPHQAGFDAQRAVFDACNLRVSYLHSSRRVTLTATTPSGIRVEEHHV